MASPTSAAPGWWRSAAATFVFSVIANDGAALSTVSAPVRVEAVVPPTVSVAVKGSANASEAGAKAKFLLSRTGSDLSQDLPVAYKLSGTAKSGVDFNKLSKTLIIPAGQPSVKVKVKLINNATKDGARTLTFKLLPSPTGDYDIGAPKKAKVSILDND